VTSSNLQNLFGVRERDLNILFRLKLCDQSSTESILSIDCVKGTSSSVFKFSKRHRWPDR
jgi:hypothetical protein